MNEKLRIIAVTSIFPNNEEITKGIYIFKQLQALSKICHVKVVAPVPYTPPFLRRYRYSRYNKIPMIEDDGGLTVYHPRYLVIPKIGRSLYGFLYFFSILSFFKRMKKDFRPDILIGFWAYPDGFVATLLSRVFRLPALISCRGCDVNTAGDTLVIKRFIQWTLKNCRKVIAVSHAMAGVIENLGVDRTRIRVIPNGIDPEQFTVIPKITRRGLKYIEIGEDEKVVLYCGRLSEEKGIMYLLEAIRIMKESHRHVRLLIVGDGPLKAIIRSTIKKLGIEDRVTILNELPHDVIPKIMGASDLVCLPSIREGWPNVVTESLACGVPVVATRVGGVPEILKSPEHGETVLPADPESLASALWNGLNKKWDRERIRNSFIQRTWDVVASEILSEVEKLVNQKTVTHGYHNHLPKTEKK